MYPAVIEPFADNKRKDSSLTAIKGFLPTSTARAVKRPVPFARPDQEMLTRLNEIAKRPPFSTYYKDKKYDPL